jgi:hypothetical protein
MRRYSVMVRLAFVLAASAALASCGGNSEPTGVAALTREPYFIRGTITSANHPWGFLVEGQPGTGYRVTSAHFKVGPNTVYLHADGTAAAAADVQVGRGIQLWITGVIMESYPVQVEAQIIVID